jgi:hypothetical protein
MSTTILAESRRGGKAVLIERLNGEFGYEYRVTVSERFRSLTKAREAFLASAPPSMAETLSRQIADNNKSSLML